MCVQEASAYVFQSTCERPFISIIYISY